MNATDTKQTCADLIKQELADREQYLADLFNRADDGEDKAQEEVWEMAYGISTVSVTRVTWSGGGPADFIEITHDEDDLIKVEYVYQDWFDGARVEVEEDSAVYRYAEQIIESLAS